MPAVQLWQLLAADPKFMAHHTRELSQAHAVLFARLSASRPPTRPLTAFAGGAEATTILSCCQGTLLSYLSTAAVLPLRAACREARAAIARTAWADAATPILGDARAWRACFPAARLVNAVGRLRAPALPLRDAELVSLRGLRTLLLPGASGAELARARAALPGTAVAGAMSAALVARIETGSAVLALAALEGGVLGSCGWQEPPRLWRATGEPPGQRWECLGSLEAPMATALVALPQGQVATAHGWRLHTRVWDAASRALVHELGEGSESTCLVALPSGQLATAVDPEHGSRAPLACLWAPPSLDPHCLGCAEAGVYRPEKPWVLLAGLSRGRLAHGYRDDEGGSGVDVLDAASGAVRLSLRRGEILTALAEVAGELLAFGGLNGEDGVLMLLCLRGSRTRPCVLEDPAGPLPGIECLAALREGALLAAGCEDGSLRLWDVLSRACVGALRGGHDVSALGAVPHWHKRAVGALAELPGGRLASGGCGGTICVWELGWG
jgi:hypothetical protein